VALRDLGHQWVAEIHDRSANLAFDRRIERGQRWVFVDVGAHFATNESPPGAEAIDV
jgi:hypothetical protein